MKTILVTGSAGFIGYHLVLELLRLNFNVIGIDNLNNYYDVKLKKTRLGSIDEFIKSNKIKSSYSFINIDLVNSNQLNELFIKNNITVVINLAAQAGVRYSIDNPETYIESNLVGFANILECCRNFSVEHLIYASSSSVYGMNKKIPFSENDNTDHPISLYAATKKSNELLAFSYSHLYNIPMTGLRFFTVYGPYGRPDMAYFKFTEAILNNKPIDIYNFGKMKRDFTYIDDIVSGILEVLKVPPKDQHQNSSTSQAPHIIYNLGNNDPVSIDRFIKAIESACGVKAVKNSLPMQAGDVPITYADTICLENDFKYKPSTSIEEGIKKFVDWYKEYNDQNE